MRPFLGSHLIMDDEGTFRTLLNDAQNGDPTAWNALLGSCEGLLATFCKVRSKGKRIAYCGSSDVRQDACIELFKCLGQFKGTTAGEFNKWVQRLCLNKIQNLRRHHGRDKRDESRNQPIQAGSDDSVGPRELAESATPVREAMRNEMKAKLRDVVARLKEPQATVVSLRLFEEASFSEIAVLMELTVGAVAGLYGRGLKIVRAEFPDF